MAMAVLRGGSPAPPTLLHTPRLRSLPGRTSSFGPPWSIGRAEATRKAPPPMMSSPARSSASATSVGAQGGGAGSSSTAGFGDDAASTCHFPRDLVTPQDRKDEALAVLKAELMTALDKEVKSLDRDSWMFAGPRSQIHLISRPGGFLRKQIKD